MSAVQQRFDDTLSRIDSVLDAQVRRIEAVEAQHAAEREEARRARMRDAMHERTEIASRYDSAFRAFGSEVPAPVDDEAPSRYRARLYNRLARRLPPDHKLASVRADDISAQPIVLDRFEEMLITAAKAEGERPSQENLPTNGEMISRARVDGDTGAKVTEWFGKQSFVKDFTRPGRKVVRIVDPRSGNAIWGAPFSRAG
jgi:hypothetical protein